MTLKRSAANVSTTVALVVPEEARGLPPLLALTLLCHPDLDRVGEIAVLGETAHGHPVSLSRRYPPFAPPGGGDSRPLDDRFLSRRPLRLERLSTGAVEIHRDGSPTSAIADGEHLAEVLTLAPERLEEGVTIELGHRVALLLHHRPLPPEVPPPTFGLVGDSDSLVRVRLAIARAAALDTPVLLTGETGTGKELVARALHGSSRRGAGPFVSVNLGALPPSLAASELFGARKGAFTGAVADQPGFFVRADGGTLFLDEVGEAPPEIQVMLLRTLETGEVIPVGSQQPRRVNVRLVSATDADLARRIVEDSFRAPLLHRLAGYPIPLPPLRRRRDDIGRLLLYFLRREIEALGDPPPVSDPEAQQPWLPASLVARLAQEPWPGNVRQLENVARQLVIDNRGCPVLQLLTPPDPPSSALPPSAGDAAAEPVAGRADELEETHGEETPRAPHRRRPSEVSEEELLAALRENRWELKATARSLGIARTSLYDLMRRSSRVRSATDVPAEEIRSAFERLGGDLSAMVEALEISERALRQRLKDLGLR